MPHEFHDDTLGDLKERDVDNLQAVLKNSKEYLFFQIQKCVSFAGEALEHALNQHGVSIRAHLSAPELLDVELQKKGIRVEHRQYEGAEDRERSGIYVYRVVGDNSEIVAFIGKPQHGRIAGTYTINTTVKI